MWTCESLFESAVGKNRTSHRLLFISVGWVNHVRFTMEAWAGRPIAFKPATFYLEIVSARDATVSFALAARLTAGFYRRITLRNKASEE